MTSFVANTGGTLVLEVHQYTNGPLVDLTMTPSITISQLSPSSVVLGPVTIGVNHPGTGVYTYDWNAPVPAGGYLVSWNGIAGTPPATGVYNAAEVLNVYTAAGNTTTGPCSGWEALDPTCVTEDWATYSPAVTGAAFDYATTVLWAATGRRFGLCTRVVRPCGKECQNENGNGIYGWYWTQGTWLPYIFQGAWRNCWCGCFGTPGCCGCNVDCQVYLEGPVSNIISVTVDGNIIDPTTYRVDNGIWLVRTKDASTDDCWPRFQDFNKNSGVGTFIVTYQKGLAVPQALLRAASELAGEYAKACVGAACRLPARATSIARQGVSISMVGIEALMEKGLTGINTVDQIIRTYNPYGLTGQMRIASPDYPERTRITTWP
jgi:hypothetical protein